MNQIIKSYLAAIGQRGGRKSRRILSSESAKGMVLMREARRAFKKYRVSCFWSFDPQYVVTHSDLHWIIEGLRKHGDRVAWNKAIKLERYASQIRNATH